MSFSHLRRPNTEVVSSLPLDQHPEPGQVTGIHATLLSVDGYEQHLSRAEVGQEHAVRRRLQTSRRRILVSEWEGDLVSSHEVYTGSCRDPVSKTAIGVGRHAAAAEKEMERCWYWRWYNEKTE